MAKRTRPPYWSRNRKKISSVLQFGGLCFAFASPLVGMQRGDTVSALLGMTGVIFGLLCSFWGVEQAQKWMKEIRAAIDTENREQIGLIVEAMGQRRRFGHVARQLPVRSQGYRRRYQYQQDDAYAGLNKALIRLLPQLRQGDLVLFTGEQRADLYQGLQERDSYLVEAILTALVQMDDRNAIPAVTELANGQWRAKYDVGLRDIARDCLEQFEWNRQQQQNRQALLRASAIPTAGADTLLHAATAPDHTPEELLRPSSQ